MMVQSLYWTHCGTSSRCSHNDDCLLVSLTLSVGVCRIELGATGATGGGSHVSVLHTKNLDVNSEGLIVDVSYFDSGNFACDNMLAVL